VELLSTVAHHQGWQALFNRTKSSAGRRNIDFNDRIFVVRNGGGTTRCDPRHLPSRQLARREHQGAGLILPRLTATVPDQDRAQPRSRNRARMPASLARAPRQLRKRAAGGACSAVPHQSSCRSRQKGPRERALPQLRNQITK
jgi:hypothetical protein